MGLSIPQMTRMSGLLDEALQLDVAGRCAWLEALPEEHQDLAQALRDALLPGDAQLAEIEKLAALPELGTATEAPSANGLQIGARVGPYQLIRTLGGGGMAEVWLARRADGAFKREVALKLPTLTHLRADLEQRFVRERDILASLEHPHIARFYDAGIDPSGLPYLAMEYVHGEPLTNWCDVHRLGNAARLKLFLQVLEAVQYAHAKHVIHRDLKPSNVLVTQSGEVQLLDFGIAKLLEAEEADQTPLTRVYGRALTPDYASPELLRGEPVDARSDIYSLGVVLYELLTGVRPYRLKSAASMGLLEQAVATVDVKKPSTQIEPEAVATRATTREQLARQLRGDLDAVALKALAKQPTERYPSAAALAEDLQRYREGKPIHALPARFTDRLRKFVRRNKAVVGVGATAVAAILATLGYTLHRETATQVKIAPNAVAVSAATRAGAPTTANLEVRVAAFPPLAHSVAVLPFVDMSEKKDQEYFSDGLSEELIDMLARVPDLRVPARTSSFYFKGKQATIADIAKALGVAHVLEGSVRKSGNTLRITAQLVSVDNGYHVWSGTYDRKLDDIFKIQDEIAGAVVKALKVSLRATVPASALHDLNPGAHEAYLKGRYYWNKRTAEGMQKARVYFQQAISKDPSYGAAYSGLADCDSGLTWHGFTSPAETLPMAKAAALKAIELDPQSAEAHASLALVLHHKWDWPEAEAEFKRALQLNPRYANAHHWYGDYLSVRGRHDQALVEAKKALDLDPLNLMIGTWVGLRYYLARKYDRAIEQGRNTVDLDPNFAAAHLVLGESYVQIGQHEKGLAELQSAASLSGNNPLYIAQVAIAYALEGRKTEALQIIAELQTTSSKRYVSPYGLAQIYAALDDKEQTFKWLQIAYDDRAVWMTYLAVDPVFDGYRSDQRFQDLLRRVRLLAE